MKETRQNFTLQKVKTVKTGGLSLSYQLKEAIGEEVYLDEETKESSKIPHPDLNNLLKSFKPTVATIFGYKSMLSAADTLKGKEKVEEAYLSLLQQIEITGVSLSGNGDNAGIVVTATYTAASGQKIAINTHRIRYVDVHYGFEHDLEEVVKNIADECYKYLFENKKAQLELFSENAES